MRPGSGAASGMLRSGGEATVLTTSDLDVLWLASLPDVQSVIYAPSEPPPWLSEVTAAVQRGGFRIERMEAPDVTRDEIRRWLDEGLPWPALNPETGALLKQDLLDLVDLCGRWTGAVDFMVRALTDIPDARCGFHVDTAPPGASPWGVLRVYCGAGTEYVRPETITNVRDFYRYMSRRDRLMREMMEATHRGDAARLAQGRAALRTLDEAPGFLTPGADVLTVPPGAIVCFKRLDVSRHWSDHPKTSAWIHRSPMAGDRRFLFMIGARRPGPAPRSRRIR